MVFALLDIFLGIASRKSVVTPGIVLDLPTIMSIVALLVGGGGLLTVLIQIWGKRVKTPADRQSEVEFGVHVLQEQLARAERAEERWLKVEEYLRLRLEKADQADAAARAENEKLRDLLEDAQAQISDLIAQRNELKQRLTALAVKYSKGEAITFADIVGETGDPSNKRQNDRIETGPIPLVRTSED